MPTLVCHDSVLKTCHWKILPFLSFMDVKGCGADNNPNLPYFRFLALPNVAAWSTFPADIQPLQWAWHGSSYGWGSHLISAAHTCPLVTIVASSGGPMPKQVLGNGWQGPNKPLTSLDERLPELRRPPSLSMSPLRARRRSFVSVLTGREEKYLKVPQSSTLKVPWMT